jgi:hypothetical protein
MGAREGKVKRKRGICPMPLDKKALKARLLAQYANHLDEILEQVEAEKALQLSEIEALALKVRQEVGQEVSEARAVHESDKQAVDVVCPDCQEVMRYKGRKGKWMKTRSGDVRVEREYYYCERCQSGHFPPR